MPRSFAAAQDDIHHVTGDRALDGVPTADCCDGSISRFIGRAIPVLAVLLDRFGGLADIIYSLYEVPKEPIVSDKTVYAHHISEPAPLSEVKRPGRRNAM